jgi:hypothetical protein
MIQTPDPLGVDPALYEALGRVIARWSYVEQILAEFLSFLVQGEPGRMYVIIQNIAGSTITDWARVLSRMTFTNEETLDNLKRLFTSIDETRSERNAYVHGLWKAGPEPLTATVTTVRWERNEVIKMELVTQDDLTTLLERTSEIYAEIAFLGGKLGFHPRPPMP